MPSQGSRRHSIAHLLSGLAVLAACMALAACGGSSSSSTAASATAASTSGPLRGVKPLSSPVSLTLSLSREQILVLPLWYAIDKGYFRQLGLDVHAQVFSGSTNELIPELATGRLDIAPATPSPGLYNQINQGFGVQNIASLGVEKPGRIEPAWLTVLPGEAGKITTLADLRGKRIEAARVGSPPSLLVDEALAQAGLTAKDATVTYRVQQPSDEVALARSKAADVIAMTEPVATEAQQSGYVHKWKSMSAVMPWFQPGLVAVAPQFLSQHRDAVVAFLAAYLAACRQINAAGGAWSPDIASVVNKEYAIPAAALAKQGGVPYYDPDGTVSMTSLQRAQDIYVSQGLIHRPVDPARLVNGSVLSAAQAELGG